MQAEHLPSEHFFAARFEPPSYAMTSNFSRMIIGTPFTVAAWVRFDDFLSDSILFGSPQGISLATEGTKVVLRINKFPTVRTPANALANGHHAWYYIAASFNGTNATIFVDGEWAASSNIVGTRSRNDEDYRIGSGFRGLIRGVALWRRYLSRDEIKTNMFTPIDSSRTEASFVFSSNGPIDQGPRRYPIKLKDGAQSRALIPSTALGGAGFVQPLPLDEINPGGSGFDAFSIQAWIRSTDDSSLPAAILVNTEDSRRRGLSLWLDSEPGQDSEFERTIRLKATRGDLDDGRRTLTAKTPIEIDRWVNVACTYHDGLLEIFINGVKEGSLAIPGPISIPNNRIILGASLRPGEPNGIHEFQGNIQSVYLWNRALSENELEQFMTADPIESEGIRAIYELGISPAWNALSGNLLGLVGNAEMVVSEEAAPVPTGKDLRAALEESEPPPQLTEEQLARARESLKIDKPKILQALKDGRDYDLSQGLAECIPSAQLAEAKQSIGESWNRVIAAFEDDPLHIGCITWHRIDGWDVLIDHSLERSEEIHRVPAGSLSKCTRWRISFIWAVFSGLMSVTGVTARLTERARNFVLNRILGNHQLMEVLAQMTERGIGATTLFVMIFNLYRFGVLWPLIKLVLSSLGWWALTRLLVNIASKFMGAGKAKFIANLVVSVAKISLVWADRGTCTLTLTESTPLGLYRTSLGEDGATT